MTVVISSLSQLHFPVADQWVLLWTVSICVSYWVTFVVYIHQLYPVFMPPSHLFSTYGFSTLLPFQCLQWTGLVAAHKPCVAACFFSSDYEAPLARICRAAWRRVISLPALSRSRVTQREDCFVALQLLSFFPFKPMSQG